MNILENISFAVGIIAIAIIIWGVVLGLYKILKNEFCRLMSKQVQNITIHQIRNQVGSYLLLGLEFLIAADIIRTIVEPTLEELAILGGIVVIRTIISYFLEREIGKNAKYPVNTEVRKTD